MIDELKAADEVRFADNGGFVSPSGLSYIGAPRRRRRRCCCCWRCRAAAAAAAVGRDAVEWTAAGEAAQGRAAAAAEAAALSTQLPPPRSPTSPRPAPRRPAGDSQHKLGTAAACAVRRVDLDVRVARAAQRAGANLMEGFEVGKEVSLDKASGLWSVKSTDVGAGRGCWARVLGGSRVLGTQPRAAAGRQGQGPERRRCRRGCRARLPLLTRRSRRTQTQPLTAAPSAC